MTKPGNSDPADRPVDSAEPAPEPAAAPPAEPTSADHPADPAPEPAAEQAHRANADPEDAGLGKAGFEKAGFEKAPPAAGPVMPTAAEAARRRGELPRPKVLQVAFYLAIASAVVGVYSAVDLFLHKAELVNSAQSIKTPKPLTAAEAERAVSSLLWLYLVVVVALGAFLALFAYKAQDGVRRARMMALIITLIELMFHFYFFATPFGQLSGLLAAITIALTYLPSTREYFGPRQTVR